MMMIGMIALWALLIWGAVYLATRVTNQDTPHPSSASDILEQRYARGEIDRDELESRRNTLQQP
jgi:uncharacterized membrane protein